jgi:hypothetical protein
MTSQPALTELGLKLFIFQSIAMAGRLKRQKSKLMIVAVDIRENAIVC